MARKRKSKDFVIGPDDLGYEEEVDMNGIVDFEDGQHLKPNEVLVSSFNFFDNNSENNTSDDTLSTLDTLKDKNITKEADENKAAETTNHYSKENILDIRTTKTLANGVTPPVDGEFFTIKRTYTLRKSTVKMLNHIKALDDDINVYMNTLVDEAIRHYYGYILNKSKNV
ncbi:hypothetical protein CFOLD11_40870 [Clostridium folliculivorans]|uniref:Uncharacterized protein n=1 Tax=Clostridium folliculivorans TaxID=2886038 RepID=A0A9W5Y656_9CLOT|nr:hypothetical protein [Clostridium folliculivorans]GKU27260.1 hypothetical protein CFOLD11_40870 [Clostridium folliculivorans]